MRKIGILRIDIKQDLRTLIKNFCHFLIYTQQLQLCKFLKINQNCQQLPSFATLN